MKRKHPKWIAVMLSTAICCFAMLGMSQPVYAESAPDEPAESQTQDQDAATDDTIPAEETGPNTVIMNLGEAWAGMEFIVKGDAGGEPVSLTVSPEGSLTIPLDGSYIFTLDFDPANLQLLAEEASPAVEPAPPVAPSETEPSEDEDLSDASQTQQQIDEANGLIPGIPNKHLFLFGGGLVICIGALVTMLVLKRRRNRVDYDEDDDYPEEDDSKRQAP